MRGRVSEFARDGSPLRLSGVIADVTERQSLEEQLAERERQLANAIDAGSCGVWELDTETGRVTLIGDAAHPMMQYFAQGACMAMEDAVAISHVLGEEGGPLDEALARYQELRALRTARVQLQSREIGQHVYHPGGAHAAQGGGDPELIVRAIHGKRRRGHDLRRATGK